MKSARVAGAFLRKDLLEAASYRGNLIIGAGGIVLTLAILSATARFIGPEIGEKLPSYGGNFLGFLVVGIALHSVADTIQRQLAQTIRQAQNQGTLEALLASRTDLPTLVCCLPLFPLVRTSLRLVGIVGAGVLLFDLDLRWEQWPLALPALGLSLLVFAAIGLSFAALTLVFQRTEPAIAAFGSLSALLGGVFFPVEILPTGLRWLAAAVPMRHALHSLRVTLLGEGEIGEVIPSILALGGAAALLLPTSLLLFRWALRRARRDGTLGQY